MQTPITVQATVNTSIAKVWECWTQPAHITQWTNASDDWHTPYADNDLRVDGKFKTTMAAKDGSFSFDFEGIYTHIDPPYLIEYTIGDGRKVKISFIDTGNAVKVIETFEPEDTNPVEMQREGWQAILNNFKKYTESR